MEFDKPAIAHLVDLARKRNPDIGECDWDIEPIECDDLINFAVRLSNGVVNISHLAMKTAAQYLKTSDSQLQKKIEQKLQKYADTIAKSFRLI